jgi:hypothetical protein
MNTHTDGMRESLEAALSKLQTARGLLSDLEWAGTKYFDAVACPSCGGLAPEEAALAQMTHDSVGHTPTCELNTFLCTVRPA